MTSPQSIGDVIRHCCGTRDPLTLKLRGGGVRRYHAEGIGTQQQVSEHSWRVFALLHHLWPDASRDLILAALYHDVAEVLIGDIPAPVKRLNPAMAATVSEMERKFDEYVGISNDSLLPPSDRLRLKACDYLELTLTCVGLPNSPRVRQITGTGVLYVKEIAEKMAPEDADLVNDALQNILKERTHD